MLYNSYDVEKSSHLFNTAWGRRGRDRMVVEKSSHLFNTPIQSVLITTNDASSNSAQARSTRYNIM